MRVFRLIIGANFEALDVLVLFVVDRFCEVEVDELGVRREDPIDV